MKKLLILIILLIANVCYGAAAVMYVTVAGGGSGQTGVDWDHAFAMSDFLTDYTTAAEDGDVYYIAGGTYSFAGNVDASGRDAAAANPIELIGVKSGTTNEPPIASDYAHTADRPYFDCTTNSVSFATGDYHKATGIKFVFDNTTGLNSGAYNVIEECYLENDTGTNSAYEAMTAGSYSLIIGCELKSVTNGSAIMTGTGNKLLYCYIHDSGIGINTNSSNSIIANCIFADCTVGLDLGGDYNTTVLNNIVHSCSTGITATTAYGVTLVNNIFDECSGTIPGTWTGSEIKINYYDYNSWDGDSASLNNITKGANSVDTDITPNADYSVPAAATTVLGTGKSISTNEGVTDADYKVNIGVDQDDNASGGGGGQPFNQGFQN